MSSIKSCDTLGLEHFNLKGTFVQFEAVNEQVAVSPGYRPRCIFGIIYLEGCDVWGSMVSNKAHVNQHLRLYMIE